MDVILQLIVSVLTWTWWIIVPVLLFLVFHQYRKRQWINDQKYILLRVSVPKENEKAPVAAEQMFASLHGLHRSSKARFFEGSVQEHVGFEIVSQQGRIHFYVYAPESQKSFVEGQIYAQYPKAEIKDATDYVQPEALKQQSMFSTELKLVRKDVYPIKTFMNFEDVDPLSGITAVMGDLGQDEEVWVQILARPVGDGWRKKSEAELKRLQGGGGSAAGGIGNFIGDLFRAASGPSDPKTGGAKTTQPVSLDEAVSSGLREKSAKLGYEYKVRIVAVGPDSVKTRNRLNAAIGAFKQYNTTNLNGFTATKIVTKKDTIIKNYRGRVFNNRGQILNIEELASIFHLPNTSVETPTIAWTTSSKGEPPENLPLAEHEKNLTVFSETNFRDKIRKFGIKPDDRRRHVYAIGKTGMGKTNMLENMVLADMHAGRGLAVVDPHGDFIETILDLIPPERVDDVIVFNPGDRAFPIAFNVLEKVDRDAKPLVASGVVGVFEKIYGHSWGPRLEHILRNTVFALLDYPDSTLLDIPKLLADKKFREDVIKYIEDPVVRNFWTDEFAGYTDKQRVEAIAPIQNKVGQFLSSTTIRNVVGQKHTAVNIRQVMDEGKIILLKLSKGELGEDASALLGAMLITKMQLAAMSRADIPEEERKDFYLYVDEFQNFATESFATILSEARKYRLNLAMANQYIAQMPEEVRDAVFGNVGTIISFRVGATDAAWLAKEFDPVFTETDVVNLDKYHIYLKMAIDGVTTSAFSAHTIPLPSETTPFRDQVIAQSRERYATGRDEVEAIVASQRSGGNGQGAGEDDKKRRFQSYLDKERVFNEKLTEDANSSKPKEKQQTEPSAKPAPKPAQPRKTETTTEHTSEAKPVPAPPSRTPEAKPKPANPDADAPAKKNAESLDQDDLEKGVTIKF